MAGRGFCVKIQLDLHAITCPGVWLCPNGKVALRVTTLGSTLESRRVPPVFPLLLHDKFTFKSIFTRVNALTELQRNLELEFLYAELIQWIVPCNQGIILATFETNLAELLYPVSCYRGLVAGADVDLLMEPSKYFPGIIVPKIEIATKTIIEEVLGICEGSPDGPYVVNPKTINSKHASCIHRKRPVKGIIRQRRVCHSQGKSRGENCRSACPRRGCESTNVEASRKCEQQPEIDKCYHRTEGKRRFLCDSNFNRKHRENPKLCSDVHIFDSCPVCSKYKCYFSGQCEEELAAEKNLISRRKENLREDGLKCVQYLYGDCCCPCNPSNFPLSQEPMSIVSDCKSCCVRDHNEREQGFYKNLERFYKRMYKQAKIRAQEVNG